MVGENEEDPFCLLPLRVGLDKVTPGHSVKRKKVKKRMVPCLCTPTSDIASRSFL